MTPKWIALVICLISFAALYFYAKGHRGEKRDVIACVVYGLIFIGASIWANV